MTEATATEAATETAATTTETAAPTETTAKTETTTPATETAVKTETATETVATDWRTKYAGDDKEALKRLSRFADEASFFKSYRSLEQKLSSGELKEAKKPLPADAKPEEVAAWRKENGVPEAETGYIEALKLPDGVVMGDADKPVLDSFAKHAHKNNWTPDKFNQAIDWYNQYLVEARARIDERDDADTKKTEDLLRTEWGADYRRNTNAIGNLLESLPDDMHLEHDGKRVAGGMLLAARLPDGTLLGRHPSAMRALAQWALDVNPMNTLLPAGQGDVKSLDTEIADIEKLMKDRSSDYWRGPKSAGIQQRYRELIEGREKMKNRAA